MLSELTYAGRPVRSFGGGWELVVRQRSLSGHGGFWGPALIELTADEPDAGPRSHLHLTSGEARVLAAQLIAVANRLDLA